jgi:kynurenine formamidase
VKFVDLSHTIEPTPREFPEWMRVDVTYHDHQVGAQSMERMLGVPPRLMRNGEGPSGEELRIGTHSATHVDAPYHYNSIVEGKPAETIDELPLDRFFGPGVVVDAREKADGDPVTSAEMKRKIAAAGHDLRPGDIVLVRTERDQFYFEPDYMVRGCGVSPEATKWLYEQGVRVMGIDAWGWDAPLDEQAARAIELDQPGIFWAAHQVDLPYSQIERLTNLGALPPTGFTIACFPLKIKSASAGLARVVAILGDASV